MPSIVKVGWLAVTLSHGEPRARTKGVDNEREHIAAVGVQRPIRIDAGLDQFSAKRQDRRTTCAVWLSAVQVSEPTSSARMATCVFPQLR